MARIGFDIMYLLRCHTREDIIDMTFKVEDKLPPNIEAIEKVFPLCRRPGVFFAYDDTIFNPSGARVDRWIGAHECVHMVQQQEQRGGVEEWWKKYLEDLPFRFQMELDAHRVEYRDYILTANRHERRAYYKIVSQKLAAPLYGNMCKVSTAERYIVYEVDYDGSHALASRCEQEFRL